MRAARLRLNRPKMPDVGGVRVTHSMKIMFSVLGEGRGHMTQAIAVKEMVEKAGHQVTHVVLGVGPHREMPSYLCLGHEDADHQDRDA